MTYNDPGRNPARPDAPRSGGHREPISGPAPGRLYGGGPQQNLAPPRQGQPYRGRPQQNPLPQAPPQAQPYSGYPQQVPPARFQQTPAAPPQPYPTGPAPQPPAPSNARGAAGTAGEALGATGRAVGGFFEVLGILLYHLIWGGIAVAGVALTGTFGSVALLATLVGAVVLILYWTTGWQIWFF